MQEALFNSNAWEKFHTYHHKSNIFLPSLLLSLNPFLVIFDLERRFNQAESVKNWKTPELPTRIHSFLGLAGYYRRFIENFSKIAKPLPMLTQKNKTYAEASKDLKAPAKWLRGLETHFERQGDGEIYFFDRIWIPSVGGVRKLIMDEAHTSRYSIHLDRDGRFASHLWQALQEALGMLRACVMDFGGSWDTHLLLVEFSYNNSYHTSIKHAPFEALYGRKCRFPVIWIEVGESQLIGPEIMQETTEKIIRIKERLKTARSHQKSYADKRRKPLEFKVGDRVLLKVSPWKGMVRFGKKGKLAPRYVGPFEIVECVGPVAYRLKLPQELSCIHDTFHVSNLKNCLAEPDVQVPLEEIDIDENLRFVEEPIVIVERDVKKLKRRRISLVKVRWNSRQGAEYTWEREDQFRQKYPHLFSKLVPSSSVAT
nr:putative reverse transcriptase domain-containing protein [Tanacetum cinerariifolium]